MKRSPLVEVSLRITPGAEKRVPAIRRKVAQWSKRMLAFQGLRKTELSILLCTDQEIRTLNRAYRNVDRSTDVLSFPQLDAGKSAACPTGTAVLGDVVVSLDTALRQASMEGLDLDRILTRLIAHGILHLLGYDHQTRRSSETMRVLTAELATKALSCSKQQKNAESDFQRHKATSKSHRKQPKSCGKIEKIRVSKPGFVLGRGVEKKEKQKHAIAREILGGSPGTQRHETIKRKKIFFGFHIVG